MSSVGEISHCETMPLADLDFSKKKKGSVSKMDKKRQSDCSKAEAENKAQRSILIERKKNYSEVIRERNMMNGKSKGKNLESYQLSGDFKKVRPSAKENLPPSSAKRTGQESGLRKVSSMRKVCSASKDELSISALDLQPISRVDYFNETSILNQSEISIEDYTLSTVEKESRIDSHAIFGLKGGWGSPRKKQARICPGEVNIKVQQHFNCNGTLFSESPRTTPQKYPAPRNQQQKHQDGKNGKNVDNSDNPNGKGQDTKCQMQEKEKEKEHKGLQPPTSLYTPSVEEQLTSELERNSGIIDKFRAEISRLSMLNDSLSLKLLMTEKSKVEEVSLCKKKMAKELAMWRERVAKLRAENLRYKSGYHRDLTLSMNISQDQD